LPHSPSHAAFSGDTLRLMNFTVKAAYITTGGVILAAIIAGLLNPSWWKHEDDSPHLVVAGTVVDEKSNESIGQAIISLAGRTETYVTEDNGNFRIKLHGSPPGDGRVRLHVTKPGYLPYDGAVTPPEENFVIPLKRI